MILTYIGDCAEGKRSDIHGQKQFVISKSDVCKLIRSTFSRDKSLHKMPKDTHEIVVVVESMMAYLFIIDGQYAITAFSIANERHFTKNKIGENRYRM